MTALVRRAERIFRLNDEIAVARAAVDQALAELDVLRHLDDDARRDAAVGGPAERADARETAADVARMERHVAALLGMADRLERRRDRMLQQLD